MLPKHVNLKSNILSLPLQSQRGPLTKQSCLKGDGKTVMTFTVILNSYVAWLHQFHPDSSPSLSAVFSSVPPLQPTGN